MMKTVDPIKLIAVIITCSSVLFSSFLFMDARHAQADDQARLEAEQSKLKRYTVYTLKELELEGLINRLEFYMAIPTDARLEYHIKEIDRLSRKIELMQIKLGVAPNE